MVLVPRGICPLCHQNWIAGTVHLSGDDCGLLHKRVEGPHVHYSHCFTDWSVPLEGRGQGQTYVPSFESVSNLLDEVTAFLVSCGVFYSVTSQLETNILECLVHGQYLLHRGADGEISHFLCYWMVTPDDLDRLSGREKPERIFGGSIFYVVEHGNKDGRKGMTRMIREIREKEPHGCGTAWRHKGAEFKHFPRQKGVGHE